jgi:uncharacterized damage-inducible protein DinB
MKGFTLILSCFILIPTILNAQDMRTSELPYYEIPDYPETYTAGSVASRMIDGLGFRYYWATEELKKEDLLYKPSEKGRTCDETLEHIYSLSKVIVNATTNTPNDRSVVEEELDFEVKRKRTLENFKKASIILRNSKDLADLKLIFKGSQGTNEFPFWNGINGPIADAIWHTGQVVLLRRASGNPFNSKASVFTGKLRE